MNRGYDNNVTFKPHPNIYNNGDEKGKQQASSQFSEPHQLWGHDIAGHHCSV